MHLTAESCGCERKVHMYQNQVYVPTTKAEALQPVDLKPSAGWFLLAAGSLLLPYVPDFIGRLLDLPNQVMANGYGCSVKKGDFELKFGRDVFTFAEEETEVQNEQKQ